MSLASTAIAEASIAAQPIAPAGTTKPPKKRQTVSRADHIQAPEAR